VVLWRGLAAVANQYVHKGSLLYIEGSLRTRQYEDKGGQKKLVTEIVAQQMVLLDKKSKPMTPEENDIPEENIPF